MGHAVPGLLGPAARGVAAPPEHDPPVRPAPPVASEERPPAPVRTVQRLRRGPGAVRAHPARPRDLRAPPPEAALTSGRDQRGQPTGGQPTDRQPRGQRDHDPNDLSAPGRLTPVGAPPNRYGAGAVRLLRPGVDLRARHVRRPPIVRPPAAHRAVDRRPAGPSRAVRRREPRHPIAVRQRDDRRRVALPPVGRRQVVRRQAAPQPDDRQQDDRQQDDRQQDDRQQEVPRRVAPPPVDR